MRADLNNNWAVTAEAIQTILRRYYSIFFMFFFVAAEWVLPARMNS